MRALATLSFLLFSLYASAGELKIKGCVRDMPYTKIYLAEITAGKLTYIDSTIANNGCFTFYVSDGIRPGMYSIVLSKYQNAFISIILNNKEDVEFSTTMHDMLGTMNFTASKENQLYYHYTAAVAGSEKKIDLLRKLYELYPEKSPMSATLRAETALLEKQNETTINNLLTKFPGSLAAVFIKAQQPVKLPAGADTANYLTLHFFDGIDFNNDALFNSGVTNSAVLKYLSLYESKDLSFTEQADNYAIALNHILEKAAVNQKVYSFYRTEFASRYRYGNYDIIGAYLMKYADANNNAFAKATPAEIRMRLKALPHVSPGRQAPDILMPTYDGKTTGLADIKSNYTLLIFWSTGCSHCTETLPELKKLYDRQKKNDLEILAVSFDTDQKIWQDFVKNGNYNWINYADLKGWQSDIAKAYDVQGTPTYILLDKEKTVIYKPGNIEELVTKLRSLNII